MSYDRVPIKDDAVLLDRAVGEIQQALADGLPWLDYSLGIAERLVKNYNGTRVYSPNLYVGKNEYRLITPDDNLGNYSFFTIDDPQEMLWERGVYTRISVDFSLIVWCNIKTILDDDNRNREEVKRQILQVLNGGFVMSEGGYTITRIYERAENVFEGFTLDEIDNQFLMQPFCGWRFAGELHISDCLL